MTAAFFVKALGPALNSRLSCYGKTAKLLASQGDSELPSNITIGWRRRLRPVNEKHRRYAPWWRVDETVLGFAAPKPIPMPPNHQLTPQFFRIKAAPPQLTLQVPPQP